MGALLACVVGAVLGSAALVVARIEVTSLRYELSHLRERETDLREQVERLHVEVTALRTPERIRPRALALGLIEPEPGQIISLSLPDIAAGKTP